MDLSKYLTNDETFGKYLLDSLEFLVLLPQNYGTVLLDLFWGTRAPISNLDTEKYELICNNVLLSGIHA
jgi:hypothetical protein